MQIEQFVFNRTAFIKIMLCFMLKSLGVYRNLYNFADCFGKRQVRRLRTRSPPLQSVYSNRKIITSNRKKITCTFMSSIRMGSLSPPYEGGERVGLSKGGGGVVDLVFKLSILFFYFY